MVTLYLKVVNTENKRNLVWDKVIVLDLIGIKLKRQKIKNLRHIPEATLGIKYAI